MLGRYFFRSPFGIIGLAGAGYVTGGHALRRVIRRPLSLVAESQYHIGETAWATLRVGQTLTFARQSRNPCDNNAVRVDQRGHKLGYVSRAGNHTVAGLLDRGEKLSARIIALYERSDDQGGRADGAG